jgi:hypothetical protein
MKHTAMAAGASRRESLWIVIMRSTPYASAQGAQSCDRQQQLAEFAAYKYTYMARAKAEPYMLSTLLLM